MGRELHKWGFLRKRAMRREAAEVLSKLNIRIKSLETDVEMMSVGQRQSISISRAVHFDAKIIIMDEPTAALGLEDSQKVVDLFQDRKKHGIGILWISHDIHDV
jgi:D-xylose transport system ATP-binding protein